MATEMYENEDTGPFLFLFFIGGLIFLILFFVFDIKYFLIEYPGGAIATNIGWYSMKDVLSFQRQITLVKERSQEELKHETMECPFCAEIIKSRAKICRYCGRDIQPREGEEK